MKVPINPIELLAYEQLTAQPTRLYGSGASSSYQRQGLALSKHFKPLPRPDVHPVAG